MLNKKIDYCEPVAAHATLSAAWVQVLYRTVELNGLAPIELFTDAGIDVTQLQNSESRVLALPVKKAWELAAERAGDPAFGLNAAQAAFPGMFHSLGVAMCASSCLAQAFGKFLQLRHVIDSLAVNAVVETDGCFKFTWIPVSGIESSIGAEAFGACLLTLCRWSSGAGFSPQRVTLVRAREADHRYRSFFKAPVEFGCDENAFYFARDDVYRPLATANKPLAERTEQLSRDYLVRTIGNGMVAKIQRVVLTLIHDRRCSIDQVAEELCISRRSLQRKLQQEGTSFEALLDGIRRDLALGYIDNGYPPLRQISHLLGFSDPSNFGRAFKRWMGLPPGEYRRKH